jgi:hypothetical protein
MQNVIKILLYVSILAIGMAFMNVPEFYFDILRVTVCFTAVNVIINDYKTANPFWILLFGFIALIFNPIFPISLHSKENWIILDSICVFVFAIKIYIYSTTSSFKNYLE